MENIEQEQKRILKGNLPEFLEEVQSSIIDGWVIDLSNNENTPRGFLGAFTCTMLKFNRFSNGNQTPGVDPTVGDQDNTSAEGLAVKVCKETTYATGVLNLDQVFVAPKKLGRPASARI